MIEIKVKNRTRKTKPTARMIAILRILKDVELERVEIIDKLKSKVPGIQGTDGDRKVSNTLRRMLEYGWLSSKFIGFWKITRSGIKALEIIEKNK